MQRFKSQINASRFKLMGQFSSSRLKKKTQDPDSWISELELMMIRLKKMRIQIDDEYLMMHIINNLPRRYDNLIENPEDRLDSIVDPLTISMLRDKLSKKYEKIKKRKGVKHNKSDDSDEDGERSLFAKTFKGRCCKFGKLGHDVVDCRSDGGFKENYNNKRGMMSNSCARLQGKCHHCC